MVHEGWVGEWGGGARNEAFKEKRCAVVGGGGGGLKTGGLVYTVVPIIY